MPQMSPYNWLILFMMFNMIMIFYMSYNNFYYSPTLKKNKIEKLTYYNWKW